MRRRYASELAGLVLSPQVRRNSIIDWPDWERDYIPEGGLRGKTVLDIGAGEGESAHFFLRHGAKSVVCVEADAEKVKLLNYNTRLHNWPVKVIHEPFMLHHLWENPADFRKIDVEGAESVLLQEPSLPPQMVMEIHGNGLKRRFETRFPELTMRRLRSFSDKWIAKRQ